MIEEQHVTQYEALQDPTATWMEKLLMHEYTECYLYWSCMKTETDDRIRALWERHLNQEIAHLHKAAQLLEKYEGKQWQQVIPNAKFPDPLRLESNIDYVRGVLHSVQLTYKAESPKPVQSLPQDDPFFQYQDTVHARIDHVASHAVIDQAIAQLGQDYRFQTAPHPIAELQLRGVDNTQIGRDPRIPGYTAVQ